MAENKVQAHFQTAELQQFNQDGYVIVRGVFSEAEIAELKNNFMDLQAKGPISGFFDPVSEAEAGGDLLKRYPRMMHPHRYNELALKYMIHPRVMGRLDELFGEQALACQSMFYFKPPGARGQALHQDNFYLKVEPGTCIAAWLAVDAADEENGGLVVVPETNNTDIQCPHLADPAKSFTIDEVDLPEGSSPVPVNMQAGDVLFFNGSVIHGSFPNLSADRFRRAFICHYTGVSTTRIGVHYVPLFKEDGTKIDLDINMNSGPCGTEFATSAPH